VVFFSFGFVIPILQVRKGKENVQLIIFFKLYFSSACNGLYFNPETLNDLLIEDTTANENKDQSGDCADKMFSTTPIERTMNNNNSNAHEHSLYGRWETFQEDEESD